MGEADFVIVNRSCMRFQCIFRSVRRPALVTFESLVIVDHFDVVYEVSFGFEALLAMVANIRSFHIVLNRHMIRKIDLEMKELIARLATKIVTGNINYIFQRNDCIFRTGFICIF